MSNLNFRKRRNRRGFFFHLSRHLPTFIVLFVIALVLGGGIFAFSRFVLKKQPGDRPVFATASEATKSNGTPSASAEADPDDPIGQLIDQADRLAKGYDYDKAMELLSQDPSIQSDPRISEALASFQSQKDSLVAADVKNVTHVFFHSLIMDTSKAFDGDSRMEGYNSVMTTKDEFLKILDALYNDGYVLVRIHDIAYETTDENGLYTLDKKQIEAYISELAAKYDTVGTERTFNTYDGREITVSGGNYGWQIDQKAELKELTELIKNGETQVREPVYSHEGLVRKTNDIGYTYIEIDLTAQRMVFYKDGTPTADAQIVSGNPFVPNCATPVGCYTTGEMKSGCTVNGEDYPSAVNYWIPFDGNLGISDAPWRMDFGGQLYEFEGTHGSICAPSDQVQIIFSNVEKNTPIVIYE